MKRSCMTLVAALSLVGLTLLAGCGPKEPLTTADRPVTAETAAPPIRNAADLTEIDLVEKMAQARKAYETYLEALHQHYINTGQYDKQVWSDKELKDLAKVRKYVYLTVADLPPAGEMKARDVIAEANELYLDGVNYYKHLPLPGLYSKERMRLALDKFKRVIAEYPMSDKVDDAAFYAGEILKEYFDENEQSVEYYKRAYEADPNTPHPAHFQRAVILDYRLHRRDEALAEYQDVLKFEASKSFFWSKSNADFAARRIRQLTEP